MGEKTPEINKETEKKCQVQTEQEYIGMCIEYALSTGWVKEQQKDILVEKYLKPIYQKYLEIIEELRNEEIPEGELAKIIIRMNNCLEATRRIGSTDPENIIKSIEDLKNQAKDEYAEYALTSLLDSASGVIRS